MKICNSVMCTLLGALPILAGMEARADHFEATFRVSESRDFYEPLAPMGHWVQLDRYGWCWYPAYVGSNWQPYSNGHWVWTEGGWYWESDEQWSWATYHYGRWMLDPYYGWVWVPGVEWAPSWVAWREGGGYVGWAPLPPGCEFGPGGEILTEHIVFGPRAFVFIEERHFCEPIRPSLIIVNKTIIHNTVNITRIRQVNNRVVVHGPEVDAVQRVSGQKVRVAAVNDVWNREYRQAERRATEHGIKFPTPQGQSRVTGEVTREKVVHQEKVRPTPVDGTAHPEKGWQHPPETPAKAAPGEERVHPQPGKPQSPSEASGSAGASKPQGSRKAPDQMPAPGPDAGRKSEQPATAPKATGRYLPSDWQPSKPDSRPDPRRNYGYLPEGRTPEAHPADKGARSGMSGQYAPQPGSAGGSKSDQSGGNSDRRQGKDRRLSDGPNN